MVMVFSCHFSISTTYPVIFIYDEIESITYVFLWGRYMIAPRSKEEQEYLAYLLKKYRNTSKK